MQVVPYFLKRPKKCSYTQIYTILIFCKNTQTSVKSVQMMLTLALYGIGIIMMYKFSALCIFNNFYNNLDYYLYKQKSGFILF